MGCRISCVVRCRHPCYFRLDPVPIPQGHLAGPDASCEGLWQLTRFEPVFLYPPAVPEAVQVSRAGVLVMNLGVTVCKSDSTMHLQRPINRIAS